MKPIVVSLPLSAPMTITVNFTSMKFQLENSDEVIFNPHSEGQCSGETCTLHKRTDHHMRSMPQHWRNDLGRMERICKHGVGHPDPDERFSYWPPEHECCVDQCCDPEHEIKQEIRLRARMIEIINERPSTT